MRLIDLKTKEEISNLPDVSYYAHEYPKIKIGKDVLKKFYRKRDLNQTYLGYYELKRMGFVIVEKRIGGLKKMFKDQIYYYKLEPKDITPSANQIVMEECPDKVRIRFDIFGGENDRGRVRLEGRGTGYKDQGYKGSWYDVP